MTRSLVLGVLLGALCGIVAARLPAAAPNILGAPKCTASGTGESDTSADPPCSFTGSIDDTVVQHGADNTKDCPSTKNCKVYYELDAQWSTGCIRSAQLWYGQSQIDSYSFSAFATGCTGSWNAVDACDSGGSGVVKFFGPDPTQPPIEELVWTFQCDICRDI